MAAFRIYRAQPAATPRAAVIVLMEAFGLTAHMRDICQRLADEGYLALAPDLYHRQGDGLEFDMASIDAALACYRALRIDEVLVDIDTVLREVPRGLNVGAVGFCMGGMLAFVAACERGGRLAGASCFYGGGIEHQLDRLERLQIPLQLHYAAQDAFIPAQAVAATCAGLQACGADYELRGYPRTGHGFMCSQRDGYEPWAAVQAWKGLLGFLQRSLA